MTRRVPANGDRPLPVPTLPLDGNGERFVPEIHEGGVIEAEHEARYRWAQRSRRVARSWMPAAASGGGRWSSRCRRRARRRHRTTLAHSASARDRAGDRAATFVQGDLEELPFEDGCFDLIVCFEAIEHVPAPERALDAIAGCWLPAGCW